MPNGTNPCPQLPGTVLRIFIPAGAVINLLNLIEVTSPSGICLIVRLPFLGAGANASNISLADVKTFLNSVGARVEVVK
jgi:hypothetical protein